MAEFLKYMSYMLTYPKMPYLCSLQILRNAAKSRNISLNNIKPLEKERHFKLGEKVEVKQQYLKIKWITFLIVLFLGLLFSISINVASAAKIQTPNVDQGESLWFDLTVNTPGVVGIDAWTDNKYGRIYLYLYDPTGKQVAENAEAYSPLFGKASLTYNAKTTGTYKVRVYLDEWCCSAQGTNVSASSNYPLGLIQSATFTPTPSPTPTPTTTAIPTTYKLGDGSILVTSFPSGARIYLDGIYKETTPKKLTDLPQGSFIVELKLIGYKDWNQVVDVIAGSTSYLQAELVPLTTIPSTKTQEDREKMIDEFKKEISKFNKEDREALVNIYFRYADENYDSSDYEGAKTYLLMAKATSEELNNSNLVDKIETLLEAVDSKIKTKERIKLIYELILALVAAVIFGYIFEKKIKNKRYTILSVIVIFFILFFIFYILGQHL